MQKKSNEDVMLERIMELICEIETKQKQWIANPNYDGCLAEDVLGMIKALNIVTGRNWRFDGEVLRSR